VFSDDPVPPRDAPAEQACRDPRELVLVTVDDHFAPSKESLDIKYKIKGYNKDDEVKLVIASKHYKDGNIYEYKLSEVQKKDGEHTIQWSGKSTCSAGDLKDRFIHPLFSPYGVTLVHAQASTETKAFKVLYHSIKIKQGPWTPDEKEPPESEEKKWVQYKLNELGYFGGPVGKDLDNYLTKAVIRYKANHPRFVKLDYKDYTADITSQLKEELTANAANREYLTAGAFDDKDRESKIRIEALVYYGDEFSKAKKADKDAERLNRPLIPLEAVILLKNKSDGAQAAPEAVGPARITWRFTDPDEDLSFQHAATDDAPSRCKDYLEQCLKLEGGRSGKNGDNCPAKFGGLRTAPDQYGYAPFLVGDHYVPYTVDKDTTQKVVFSKACVDKDSYPKRLGKAGVFFRPSIIAGDAYRIKAELDFTGLANKDELERLHGITNAASRPSAETGTFRVWRTSQVALLVNWPARRKPPANHPDHDWDKVKAEFAKAYLEVDTSRIATKGIAQVITEDEYKAVVAANTAHTDRSLIQLHVDAMVGVALPAQGTMAADAYKTALKQFVAGDYSDKMKKPLQAKLSEAVRKTLPSGFIIVPFLTHKPVDVKKAPGAGDDTVLFPQLVLATSSISQDDSVIYVDQKDPDAVYCVTAHEMGHNFFLKHWENAPGQTPADHDLADHNCMMSYTGPGAAERYPHQAPGVYQPHFCGKCNLKLRGWDVTHVDMPPAAPLDTELALVVDVSKAKPIIDEVVTYTIKITNRGPKEAAGVKVSEHWQSGISVTASTATAGSFDRVKGVWTVGALAVNAEATLTLQVKVTESAKNSESVEYGFSVIAPIASAGALASAKISVPKVGLRPSVFAWPPSASEGEVVEVSLKVKNEGPDPATGVKAVLTWPAGFEYAGFSDISQGSWDAGTKTWTIGDMAKDAQVTAKLKGSGKPSAKGTSLEVKAKATADQPDSLEKFNESASTIQVKAVSEVGLRPSVSAWPQSASEGEEVEISLKVKNEGPGPATGVKAVLTWPAGFEYASFSEASQGTTWDAGAKTWTIGALAKGAEVTAKLRGSGKSSAKGTSLEVKAKATADQPDSSTVGNESASTFQVKAASETSLWVFLYVYEKTPAEGGEVRISTAIKNTSQVNATGVKAAFTLPAGLTPIDLTGATQGAYVAQGRTWNIGGLAAGAEAKAVFKSRVDVGAKGKALAVNVKATADQTNTLDPDGRSATVNVKA
jgi:uncharacterized repeat protein (TIGR01451 family)